MVDRVCRIQGAEERHKHSCLQVQVTSQRRRLGLSLATRVLDSAAAAPPHLPQGIGSQLEHAQVRYSRRVEAAAGEQHNRLTRTTSVPAKKIRKIRKNRKLENSHLSIGTASLY